jgi:acetylornithine deacetylase/succinyl-diaminopimelate desuccinylase-like protein
MNHAHTVYFCTYYSYLESINMEKIQAYLSSNQDRFIKELIEFLSIPSVSTAPEHNSDVAYCGNWLKDHLSSIGMKTSTVYATAGHPIVYAEHCEAGPEAPTVLFYGHYDVQPVDPLHLWTNPPFEPTLRDGKIFARGSTDDKGQVFLHCKAIEAMLAVHGTLPVNVKMLIEGEEEIGSIHLEQFIREHLDLLSCDTVVVSDTPLYGPGMPSLCYGLRGLCYMEVHITGPNRDLHSGSYGGSISNPLQALCEIIAKLKDSYGRIAIPGFYDNVKGLTEEERLDYSRLPFNAEEFRKGLDVSGLFGEYGYTTLEHISARPTLDVNGIIGGFTGVGAKTVLPSKASAKISMRLVANQDTQDIASKFTSYVKAIAPPTVQVEVENLHGANPVLVEKTGKGMNAAKKALQEAYGCEPYFTREGGSIPVCLLFDTILKAPTVLMGFGLQDENAHSPDEHFSLDNFRIGMYASSLFYNYLAE